MNRVLLDTSVYGRLVEDFELVEKIGKLVPNEYVIYGNSIIRNELRDTPKPIKLEQKSKRI